MTDTIVDKLLLEKIALNKQEISVLEEQVQSTQRLAAKLYADNIDYTVAYQKACPHPVTEKVLVSHIGGGYDHVSQDNYNIVCVRCKKVVDSKLVRGTYA